MFNPVRGAFPLRIGTALAAGLLLLGAAAPASATCSPTPTAANCRAAWNDSAAQDTCGFAQIYVTGGQCRVSSFCDTGQSECTSAANCGSNQTSRNLASIDACVDDIEDLHNCGGDFEVGGC